VLTELSHADDATLIERSVAEPDLFRLVYERHAGALHRYAARRIGPDAADDVVAETFLVAFRRRARYDARRPVAGPWLYGIASNLIARHRRAEVRMYRAYARTGVDPVAGSVPQADVEARLDAAGQRRALAGALARLAARDRDVLLLVAWGGLAYEEVARALDIPVGTVRSRLNRARRQVQAALATTEGENNE
jgi:RNA polymerase sigma-70 factor (ECF subfamily)